jgi:hypothetical protein
MWITSPTRSVPDAGFFLAAVFLRVVALATGGFLRFALVLPLAFFLVGI